MSIDIERLKTDAAYWDERGAPEDATHYCPVSKLFYNDSYPIAPCCIPRPTKPAAPEWVDGLPPVGCECELKRGDEWVPVKITGKGERVTVFRKLDSFMEHITEAEAHEFRPLSTPEQRQKEELADFLRRFDKQRSIAWCEDAADAIIAAGWRKED